MREYRCPDCGGYCPPHPLGDRAYCPRDGWFDLDDAPHATGTEPA